MAKALALLSGGLDSSLAAAVLLQQGVPVHALTFVSLFTVSRSRDGRKLASAATAEELGIPLTVVNWSRRMCEVVKAPRYGYGRNINPCIDCRLAVLTLARERMGDLGCDFVITGEVLGERPMSQRRPMLDLVQAKSALGGLLLRPLSALLLAPTLPEERGWVDRSRLLAIEGRSRKPQMELARRLGLREYSTPAGGCLLTDPAFASRLKDLMQRHPEWDLNDAHLLKVGRHFRFGPAVRCVVGRNERENGVIRTYARKGDALLEASEAMGPLTLLRGPAGEPELRLAAALTARYGKARTAPGVAVSWRAVDGVAGHLRVAPARDEEMAAWRVETPGGERGAE